MQQYVSFIYLPDISLLILYLYKSVDFLISILHFILLTINHLYKMLHIRIITTNLNSFFVQLNIFFKANLNVLSSYVV